MNEALAPRGWQAQLDLEYALRANKTRLFRKQQRGPLTVQRSFYPEGEICHNYILHPPGGVVGGDTLEINVDTGETTHALLTTPGATKFYRSSEQRLASQSQNLTVGTGAVLEWLPQQNIFFPGANVALNTQIDIAPDGRFAGWEMHCFGRPANGETFSTGSLRSRTIVKIAGELRLVEQLNTLAQNTLVSPTGLRGHAMQGCLIAGPCNIEQRDMLEQILLTSRETGSYTLPVGITLIDEVLIVRALGEQSEPMHELFTRFWLALRQHWLEIAPCVPRIWAT